MHSAIYEGVVRHRRFLPHRHQFSYRLFQVYLDLDELDEVFAQSRWFSLEKRNLATFRRADYLGESGDLKSAVRDCVAAQGLPVPQGPVRMLTHLRYFGYCFNPVTFYYLFEPDGHTLSVIVAEITNTPWKERFQYVLPVGDQRVDEAFAKQFHVSPFIGMERDYRWRFTAPESRHVVHMDVTREGENEFDATLVLRRRPISSGSLSQCLRRYPMMCSKVVIAIHWQAFKLWLKRVPVFEHPAGAEKGS
ncbi:MAG: DUF1365 domain-containing protein [Pseudomonadota bacterium]